MKAYATLLTTVTTACKSTEMWFIFDTSMQNTWADSAVIGTHSDRPPPSHFLSTENVYISPLSPHPCNWLQSCNLGCKPLPSLCAAAPSTQGGGGGELSPGAQDAGVARCKKGYDGLFWDIGKFRVDRFAFVRTAATNLYRSSKFHHLLI